MNCAPAVSCVYGGTVRELHAVASKNHSVLSVFATACICDCVLSGVDSLSKQWLAPKNHGICVADAVSFSSVPVHRYTLPVSLNTICATALRVFRNACELESDEQRMSTLQAPDAPMSCVRLPKPLAMLVKTC